MILRDRNTGDFELYDFSKSPQIEIANAQSLGNVGTNWQTAGLAQAIASVPSGAVPSSGNPSSQNGEQTSAMLAAHH